MQLRQVNIWREEQAGKGPGSEMRVGDVRALLPGLIEQYASQAQVVYLDPPFRTGQVFSMRARVGEKEWKSGAGSLVQAVYRDDMERGAYMEMMREVLTGARELLSDSGVIYVHVDYHMYAYIRLLMDEIFGESNFLNEIIWSYQTGGRARRFFSRKHDVILFYRKGRKYYFNLEGVPVSRLDTRRNHMKRHVDADGRVYRSIKSGGKIYTYYDDEPAFPGDVWDDVSHLQQKDPQRTGYDTQKPVRLLERIIKCSTQEGDLVCDLFAGSGTTAVAAANLNRRFLCVDQSPLAVAVAGKRLSQSTLSRPAGVCYDVEAPCGEDDCFVEAEVFPAITSYTVHLMSFDSVQAREAGVKGLDAVDHWSAGFVQGDVYRSCVASVRTATTPQLQTTMEMPVCAGEPCIMIVDIWGSRRFYLPKRRY